MLQNTYYIQYSKFVVSVESTKIIQ